MAALKHKAIEHLHNGHNSIFFNLRNLRKVRRGWKHLQKKSGVQAWPQSALRYPDLLKVVEKMQDPDDSQEPTEVGFVMCFSPPA